MKTKIIIALDFLAATDPLVPFSYVLCAIIKLKATNIFNHDPKEISGLYDFFLIISLSGYLAGFCGILYLAINYIFSLKIKFVYFIPITIVLLVDWLLVHNLESYFNWFFD